jgi:hypothetical protein
MAMMLTLRVAWYFLFVSFGFLSQEFQARVGKQFRSLDAA